jgi:hypothetical protein
MNHYKLLPLTKILQWEDEAERLKVSEIARGPNGFLTHLKSTKGELSDPYWIKKRNGFIARTYASFKKKPSFKKYLSLIMWGFDPLFHL